MEGDCTGESYIEMCQSKTRMNLSILCLNIDTFENIECYPYGKSESFAAFVWCILNSVFGCIGNLLTIFVIPYAIHRKL